jgi:hypothetical protein
LGFFYDVILAVALAVPVSFGVFLLFFVYVLIAWSLAYLVRLHITTYALLSIQRLGVFISDVRYVVAVATAHNITLLAVSFRGTHVDSDVELVRQYVKRLFV